MTATDELRRMLTDAGVEWKAPASYDGSTKYDTIVDDHWFHEYDGRITVHGLTPEQAIAATVGRGTCHKVLDFDGAAWICSECGEHIGPRRWNFCPNCGRKVVDG